MIKNPRRENKMETCRISGATPAYGGVALIRAGNIIRL